MAADLTHKSDAGAVRVNVGDAAAVERACQEIARNVAAYDPGIQLEGWLVAGMAPAGLELVLGMQRDPEMGAVVMFGAGGVWLELVKDVAFGPPGLNREGAARLIDSTRIGRLLDGYRGEGPYDRDAVVDALVALGRWRPPPATSSTAWTSTLSWRFPRAGEGWRFGRAGGDRTRSKASFPLSRQER